MNIGFDRPLYIQPFDHRGSFQTKMFGWKGKLNKEQIAEVAAAKQVIYDGFKAAVAVGVPKEKAGILVDEQFGAPILRDAAAQGYLTACPAEKTSSISSMATILPNTSKLLARPSAKFWCDITRKVTRL
jgi:myo-inositol catabolism protein IolC